MVKVKALAIQSAARSEQQSRTRHGAASAKVPSSLRRNSFCLGRTRKTDEAWERLRRTTARHRKEVFDREIRSCVAAE